MKVGDMEIHLVPHKIEGQKSEVFWVPEYGWLISGTSYYWTLQITHINTHVPTHIHTETVFKIF